MSTEFENRRGGKTLGSPKVTRCCCPFLEPPALYSACFSPKISPFARPYPPHGNNCLARILVEPRPLAEARSIVTSITAQLESHPKPRRGISVRLLHSHPPLHRTRVRCGILCRHWPRAPDHNGCRCDTTVLQTPTDSITQ